LSIRPYRSGSIWVFDFEPFGLVAEAFVGDINKMIDAMLERAGLPKNKQFTALFSANPFPGVQMELKWVGSEYGGNDYMDRSLVDSETKSGHVEGWLCPVLCLFFGEAPRIST
jgi:hypothetical protein